MLPNLNMTLAQHEGVHEIFARQAIARPDAVALLWGGEAMSYADLNRAADHGATSLSRSGVMPGVCVPVLLPRSPQLVVSLLAVLKAGAAYALLDPAWPQARLKAMIDALVAPLLIAETGSAGVTTLPTWVPPLTAPAALRERGRVSVSGDSPCCVFFTSGTSGRPKAVLSPHRATARLFQGRCFAHFAPGTVIPLAAPVPWDAFSLELWGALLNGGTSWIVQEPYLSAQALRDGILEHGVDTAWLTAGLFNVIVEEDIDAFVGLRQVMTGGERLSVRHVRMFLQRHPQVALINGYGPVESTIFASTHRVQIDDCFLPDGIPIGCPVTGTRLHIVAADGHLCADGEIGEICIAGDGLALEYLHDAALTEQKFVQIQVHGQPTRIYRTGDLGYTLDGVICFKGRADRQVKIRGHRVEPAEVERQVEALLTGVRSCRVVARSNAVGASVELVAFCIPAVAGSVLEGASETLRTCLVAHHCPSMVVPVHSFPLTPQGKLDELALLSMAPPSAAEGTPFLAPARHADPLKTLVAETFAAVLGRASVPLDIPLLQLGGTSLDLARISARLGTELGQAVPVSWLYLYPTAASLASRLTEAGRVLHKKVPPVHGATPLTSMQRVYLARHLADPADRTSHCLLAWLIEGELDVDALQAGIDHVHRRHESLRAAYVPDPGPVASPVDIPPPPLEILPSQSSTAEALAALRAELSDGLELEEGDIWRVALCRVYADGSFVLGCVVHHIAFDGWSESILATDLSAGYNAACGGATAASPAPPSLAATYAVQAALLAQANVADHDSFLKSELAGAPQLVWPNLPMRPSSHEDGHRAVTLSAQLVKAVDSLASNTGATRFEVLLSHWARALADVTGQRDFVLGVPIRQRWSPLLENALGCHINMVCIRMRGRALVEGTDGVAATVRIVRRALATQEVPFERVLEVADVSSTSRPPLFQTLFAFQDNLIPHLRLADVRSAFFRQPYLDLPLELHAEIWPSDNGELRLVISHRVECVSADVVHQLADRFIKQLGLPVAELAS